MAKGYIIYVDGRQRPNVVHKTLIGAYAEMYRLARKCPGQEVWLLKLQKRVICRKANQTAESAGSHLPRNGLPTALVTELLTSEKLRDSLRDEWPENQKSQAQG